jgi:hypothetical protein
MRFTTGPKKELLIRFLPSLLHGNEQGKAGLRFGGGPWATRGGSGASEHARAPPVGRGLAYGWLWLPGHGRQRQPGYSSGGQRLLW